MSVTEAHLETGIARSSRPAKAPLAALIIAGVEVALGAVTIGLVLQSAGWRDSVDDYIALVAYGSSALLAAAAGFVTVALLSAPAARQRRLLRSHVSFAAAAFATTVANLVAWQVDGWTTTLSCDGCDASMSVGPTAQHIAATLVLDLGAGLVSVLLPVIVLLLLRNRREAAATSAQLG